MKIPIYLGIVVAIAVSTQADPSSDSQLKQINEGMTGFSYRWAGEMLGDKPNVNLITSGISTGMALAMMSLGAGGNTKAEIKTALNFTDSDEVTKIAMKQLNEGFEKAGKVDIKIANRVFAQAGFEMMKDFKESTLDVFRAEAQDIDFGNKNEASKTINNWVESKTNNRIKNLMSPDDVEGNSMVLVNAIYFNGKWKKPFQSAAPKLWHMDDTISKNVSTMHIEGHFSYGDLIGVDAKYVILPYKSEQSDGQYSMFVIIPNEITGLKSVEENMRNIKWKQSLSDGHRKNLIIDMPKFKMESTIDVASILKKMKINDMFGSAADFSGISKRPLKVSKAVQKAFIDVNEEGSEATAATGMGIMLMSMPMPPIHLKIDRPFLFSIVMQKGDLNALLFNGRVMEPKYE